jgi:hypothetical protein
MLQGRRGAIQRVILCTLEKLVCKFWVMMELLSSYQHTFPSFEVLHGHEMNHWRWWNSTFPNPLPVVLKDHHESVSARTQVNYNNNKNKETSWLLFRNFRKNTVTEILVYWNQTHCQIHCQIEGQYGKSPVGILSAYWLVTKEATTCPLMGVNYVWLWKMVAFNHRNT